MMDKHFDNFDEAIDFCKEHTEDILNQMTVKDKRGKGYVCNLCGNGTGKKGDGLRFDPHSKDGKYIKCFGGKCGFYGDILEYVGQVFHIEESINQIKKCGELLGYNITIGDYRQQSNDYQKPTQPKSQQKKAGPEKVETEVDYTNFILQANKNIEKTDYHRGISLETLNRFKIGFCESWKHPKRPKMAPSRRLIIPTSKHSYEARDTRANIPEDQEEDKKQKVGSVRVFNWKALKEATQPIYVVEAPIDALSIIDAGGEAVAMGSAHFIRIFMEELSRNRPKQPLVIALDNDGAGEKWTPELKEKLDEAKIDYYTFNPSGEYKDPNEALTADREAFTEQVNIGKDREKAEQERYKRTSAYHLLQGFVDGISDSINDPPQSTGFKQLDYVLHGGVRKGVYLIGAVTSLGKTTLAIQIADYMAQSGRDIIFFTLEMDTGQLISKSISRHTYIESISRTKKDTLAKTSVGITDGTMYEKYSSKEKDVIQKSIENYSKYAGHIYFREGYSVEIGVDEIKKEVSEYIRINKKKPIVFIDYFQFLKPFDVRATDKANADANIKGLTKIVGEFKIPIIAISSFNRQNYNTEVTLTAFKESGNIEYSSDVAIGLQFHNVGKENFSETQAKKKNPRDVELVILKARNGGLVGEKVRFKYNAYYNYFEEIEQFEDERRRK